MWVGHGDKEYDKSVRPELRNATVVVGLSCRSYISTIRKRRNILHVFEIANPKWLWRHEKSLFSNHRPGELRCVLWSLTILFLKIETTPTSEKLLALTSMAASSCKILFRSPLWSRRSLLCTKSCCKTCCKTCCQTLLRNDKFIKIFFRDLTRCGFVLGWEKCFVDGRCSLTTDSCKFGGHLRICCKPKT